MEGEVGRAFAETFEIILEAVVGKHLIVHGGEYRVEKY